MAVKISEHFTYKKIFLAVIAPIFMMVFISIYSIVDGLFVSNFAGESSFAGINLIWPVTMIVGGLGFMLGTGGCALSGKYLGEGNKERASKVFSMVFYFNTIISILLSTVFYFLMEPFSYFLASFDPNSSQEMIDSAIIYGKILIIGEVFFMNQNLFQNFFLLNEKGRLAFIITILAGLTNFVLDAVFIAWLKMGVVGAGIATVIGQAVGTIIPIVYFILDKKGNIHLVLTKLEGKPILKSITNGFSEFISNISAAFVGIIYNIQLLKYVGEAGLNAYGIIMYLAFIFTAIFIGYCIGVSPIVAYNYGAKNNKELKNILVKSILIITIIGILMIVISESLAPYLCMIFFNNEELLAISINGLRIYAISFLFTGICIFASNFFTSLNNGLISGIISFTRTLVLQLILVFVLPLFLDLNGIWLTSVIAEGLTVVLSIIFFVTNKKKYHY